MARNGSAAARPEPIETEWQFDALDLGAVERWLGEERRRSLVAPGEIEIAEEGVVQRLADTYYDSADWRIGRAGYVLRERHRRGRVESTLKSIAPAEEGLRRRIELTEPRAISEFASSSEGDVARRVVALAGSAPLRAVIEVVTKRRPRALIIDGAAVGELALDETTITVPGLRRKLHLRRVELEIANDALEAGRGIAEQLRRGCALAPATLSKFEAGLLFGGLSIPGAPDLGPTAIDKGSTIGELALAAVRRDAQALIAHEPGTRLGEDIEELHQMRVATRRLRAALSQFEDVLPVRAVTLREEIGWLAGLLGRVRDLDVQIEQTEEWIAEADELDRPHLEELAARLDAERAAARRALLEGLDSRRYERLVSGLASMLRTSTGRRNPLARTPGVIALPGLIERRQRSVTKAAKRARRTGRATDFHDLRIRVKRLRYALEFTGDAYGTDARRYVKVLSTLQGRLGAMQDAEVAADRLRSVALTEVGAENPLSLGAVFTVGGLAARYRAESMILLSHLGKEVGVCSGPAWRRLLRRIEAERDLALAQRLSRRSSPGAELHPLPLTTATTSRTTPERSEPAEPVLPRISSAVGPNRPFNQPLPPHTT